MEKRGELAKLTTNVFPSGCFCDVASASELLVSVKRQQLGVDKRQRAEAQQRQQQQQAAAAESSGAAAATGPPSTAMSEGDVDGEQPADGAPVPTATQRKGKASKALS